MSTGTSQPSVAAAPSSASTDKKMVPRTEKTSTKKHADFFDLVARYDLGEMAFADTFGGASGLWRKVRTVVGKVGVGLDGEVTVRWAKTSLAKKVSMVSLLHKAAPWLAGFENFWGAEWLLSKAINQRVTDGNRAANKRRRDEMMAQLAQTKAAPPTLASSQPPASSPLPSSPLPFSPPASTPPISGLPISSPPISSAPAPLSAAAPTLPAAEMSPNEAHLAQQVRELQAQLKSLIAQQHTARSEEAEISRPVKRTRRKGASKIYQEAIRIERESEDEREVRRARKAEGRRQKHKEGEDLDGLLMELGMGVN